MNLKAELTDREQQVAKLLAWGASKKMIAGRLGISEHTVDMHVRSVYQKASVKSLGEFCAWWFCKHFNISLSLNPLIAIALMVLLGVNELHGIKRDYVRARVRNTRLSRKVRRRDDNNTTDFLIA